MYSVLQLALLLITESKYNRTNAETRAVVATTYCTIYVFIVGLTA
jgi:hypothetical protein